MLSVYIYDECRQQEFTYGKYFDAIWRQIDQQSHFTLLSRRWPHLKGDISRRKVLE